MNKVKRRAMSALLVAVLVLGGIGVYIVRYIEHGAEWATFAANSSVYTSGVLSTGTLTDRSGVVLATANGGSRSYADDAAVRTACYQALQDFLIAIFELYLFLVFCHFHLSNWYHYTYH